MMVPLMIWSARIEIDSQAWRAETSIPVAIAATRPAMIGRVAPKIGDGLVGPIVWATRAAARNAVNAELSIIPSMPMFTTPERSFMIPHSAPRAIGAASATKIGAISGTVATR